MVLTRHKDSMRVGLWEPVALALLSVAYGVAEYDPGSVDVINAVGPMVLAAILSVGAFQAAQAEPAALWTGLLWIRIASAVYFGLGTVVHLFANYETVLMIYSFFQATPDQILTFNLIVSTSLAVILTVVAFLARVYPSAPFVREKNFDDQRMLFTIGVIITVIGFSVKFFISLPITFGLLTQTALPGIVVAMEHFTHPAIFLMTLWCLRAAPRLLPVMVALVVLTFLGGLIRFIKAEALLPLFIFMMAMLYHKSSAKRLVLAAAVGIAAYAAVSEPVSFGRTRLQASHGTLAAASVEERVEILGDYYFKEGAASAGGGELQGSLARIAYVHSSAPAIAFYDRGIYGDSLQDALVIFIPRSLWPEKPIFDHGIRYSQLVNGNGDSSSWMGYFVEAYWNLGWAGIPLVMIPLGAALFAFGRYTQFVLYQESWLHFPMIFMGMFLGMRVDGSLVTEFLGTCGLAVGYHVMANMVAMVIEFLIVARRQSGVPSAPRGPEAGRR
jgi:hypothetical protein